MSRNGSGVYSLPAGNPVVTGTTISSSWANTTLSDIATALTGSVAADGQTAMTGNLQMGNNKITGLAVASASGDALSFGQAATISALTVSGTFAANGGATLGDGSGDALTINSSAVSIPNGLNFDSNTLVIDATNDRVGVGTASPQTKVQIASTAANTLSLVNNSSNISRLVFSENARPDFTFSYIEGDGRSTGYLAFRTNDTERMRLDASGSLIVGGTSSPSGVVKFYAEGAGAANRFRSTSTTASGATIEMLADGATAGTLSVNSNHPLTFATNSAERMRIASSGTVGINTTPNSRQLSIVQNISNDYVIEAAQLNSTGHSIVAVCAATNTSARYYEGYSSDTATTRYIVYSNGNVVNTSNSYGAISDIKLKENIVDATPKLEKLNQVRVVNYNLIGDEQKQIGVIAQEIEQIFPSMIEESADFDREGNDLGTTTKSVKYSVFVPMLIKAIQEQQAIITDLKARIESLENK
jgi:hypothetical protein